MDHVKELIAWLKRQILLEEHSGGTGKSFRIQAYVKVLRRAERVLPAPPQVREAFGTKE